MYSAWPVAVITAILILTSLMVLLSPIGGAATGTSLPISIENNASLAIQAQTNGWPGNGTASNPYIIANLDISATGSQPDISIADTNAHLTIDRCTLGQATYGVHVNDASNVTVEGNQLSSSFGVFLVNTVNSSIFGNTVSGSDDGIYLSSSSDIGISYNTINSAGDDGIHLDVDTTNITVANNTVNGVENDGIFSDGSDNSISFNSIGSSQYCGVFLDFDNSYNTVDNNTITNAANEGVYSNGTGDLIMGNLVTSAGIAASIWT